MRDLDGDGAWPAPRWVAGGRGVERESQQSVIEVCAQRWSRALARYSVGKVLAVSAVSSFVPV